MEALYSKLYNKYTKLKKEKDTELDKLNRDQEAKFLNFVAAADEMIQYLKSENERLNGEVHELKSELASIRSSNVEQHSHFQELLMKENQKNKELLEEIARLQNLEHDKPSHNVTQVKIGQEQEPSPEDAPVEAPLKKRKSLHSTEGTATAYVDVELDHSVDLHVYADNGAGAPSISQPICCQRKIYNSGGDNLDTCSVICVFQHLVEFVVGMKVSVHTQSNELCVLVKHQSSGYSFSLAWITNAQGEEELLYRVVSMGMFERIAPEWMKETVMFSTSMCGIFFERVSRFIKS